jgi:hypothetical protein
MMSEAPDAPHPSDSISALNDLTEYVMNSRAAELCRSRNKCAFPFESRHNPA